MNDDVSVVHIVLLRSHFSYIRIHNISQRDIYYVI